MKKGSKKIKKSQKTKEGILSYEIIDNTEQNKSIILEKPVEPPKEPQPVTVVQQPTEHVEHPKKNYLKTLVTLIIILIIIDLIFLFWYFKPDIKTNLSNFFKPKVVADTADQNGLKCNDGTVNGACSKNKPLYCYSGELIKKAATCGCPEGYKVDFQSCKKI